MKQSVLLLLFFGFFWGKTAAQTCLPGGITFTSQSQINNFAVNYPGCTQILGNVTINSSNITNFNGLSQIAAINGTLHIARCNASNLTGLGNLTTIGGDLKFNVPPTNQYFNYLPNLNSLAALSNLTSIGGNITLTYLPALTSLNGLQNLTAINGSIEITIVPLTSLSALQGITTIPGNLYIGSTQLTNLDDLSDLISIGGNLNLSGNSNLSSLAALSGLTTIGGILTLGSNPMLNSLAGLQNVSSFNSLYLYNTNLPSLSPLNLPAVIPGNIQVYNEEMLIQAGSFSNVTSIGGNLELNSNTVNSSFTGFDNLEQVGGNLWIWFNTGATSLSGFGNLEQVGGDVHISNNFNLQNLTGLQNLTAINGGAYIAFHPVLQSLNGLNSTLSISGDLGIYWNDSLSNCAALAICDYLSSPPGNISIYDNLPDCNSSSQILAQCNAAPPACTGLISPYPGETAVPASTSLTWKDATNLPNAGYYLSIGTTPNGTDILNNFNVGDVLTYDPPASLPYNTTVYVKISPYNVNGINTTCPAESFTTDNACPAWLGLYSQSDVNNFPSNYPDCTAAFNVEISGSDITNLASLNQITTIAGDLYVVYNDVLPALNGFANLESVGGSLFIWENPALTTITGFNNIEGIGSSLYIFDNPALTTITGLNSLDTVGAELTISDNPSLTSLPGFGNLTTVQAGFLVGNNSALSNLTPFANLSTIGGYLIINDNTNLTSLNGLNGVTSIGGSLQVVNNAILTNLSGVDNIAHSTITDLYLQNSVNLSSCDVQSICDYLAIPTNPATISGNATGCATRPEVEYECSIAITCTNLTNPVNGATNVPLESGLTWAAASGAAGYKLNVGTTPGGTNILNNLDVGNVTSYNPPGNFPVNSTIYVRIVPYNVGGDALGCMEESFATTTNPCPPGGITFFTQAQVDSFPINYPGCTQIVGDVCIGDCSSPYVYSAITNLSALSQLNSINGQLFMRWNGLSNFNGLHNIQTINGNLRIHNISGINDLEGLSSLDSVMGVLDLSSNYGLVNLNGLDSIQHLGALSISNNGLQELNALSNINSLLGGLYLAGEYDLAQISGLQNVESIETQFVLNGLPDLPNLYGLQNLSSLNPQYNFAITNCLTLSGCGIPAVCDYLSDPGNPASIGNNATGCATRLQVETACTANPPLCTALTSPLNAATNVPITTSLTWAAASGATGYKLTMGTTSGGTDILNNVNLGNVTTYDPPGNLPSNTVIYVKITPYNANGDATGCTEESFTTENTAAGCLPGGILFSTQAQIDAFPTNYPGCTEILGNVTIEECCAGAIMNLNGLSQITSIDGGLFVYSNPQLTSLTGLENLTSINGAIEILNNQILNSLTGIQNINATGITHLSIVNNQSLGECAVQSVCDYLNIPMNTSTVFDNIGNCESIPIILVNCPSSAPACTAITNPLNGATNVPVTTSLTWVAANTATGYKLTVGTTPGGTDILNNVNLGNVTTYDPPGDFPSNTVIYVKIIPYNASGDATGCTEESFTTEASTIPFNDDCANATLLTMNTGSCTPILFDNTGATASATTGCGNSAWLDYWFETTSTQSAFTIEIGNIPFSTGRMSVYSSCGGSVVFCTVISAYTPWIITTPPGSYKIRVSWPSVEPAGDVGICTWEVQQVPAAPTLLSLTPSSVQIKYHAPINPATAANLKIWGDETGQRTGTYTVSADTVTFTASVPFRAGELIHITSKSAVQFTGGAATTPFAWQRQSIVTNPTAATFDTIGTGIVLPAAAYAYGYNASMADLNLDGLQDLVYLYYAGAGAATNLRIYLRNGNGTFAAPLTYSNSESYSSLIGTPDLNNDGYPDLVVSHNFPSSIQVRLNNGAGGFGSAALYTVTDYCNGARVADMDNDGDLDIIAFAGNASLSLNTISILKNNGNGTFAAQVTTNTSVFGTSCQPADLDNDGDMDLAYTSNTAFGSSKVFRVYQNDGTGALTLNNSEANNQEKTLMPAFDYNGDGNVDLITRNPSTEIYLNNSGISYSLGSPTLLSAEESFPLSGDLNGDGDLDVLIPNSYNGTNWNTLPMKILSNNGTGTFTANTTPLVLPTFFWGTSLTDYDSDGDLDYVYLNPATGEVKVLRNGGLTVPACTNLTDPTDGSNNVSPFISLTWAAATGASGYSLTAGTTPGGTDILNNVDVGNVTTYDPPGDLPYNSTIYVKITPYNASGDAVGCPEESFNTPVCTPNLTVESNPIPSGTYHADGELASFNSRVANGATVWFFSDTSILLNYDFEVELGGVFEAIIEVCP